MANETMKGNQFWRLRKDMTEDGRKLSINQVQELSQEYIDRCVKEKLYEIDFRGKDAMPVEIPKMIGMSIWGLCHHLGITFETWSQWRKDKKYSEICMRVETVIKAYNIEGAASGFLNHAIIARLEGLKDSQDHNITQEEPLRIKINDKTIEV